MRIGERRQGISAPMERALLALLVVKAGRLATSEWLINGLWPDEKTRPETKNTLQTYVSHLRPKLEPERQAGQPWRVLRREANGYLLDVGALDVHAFETQVDKGTSLLRAGQAMEADEALTAALGLWRADEAFTDVTQPEPDPVRTMIDELARKRLGAVKTWGQARIDIGRGESVLTELGSQRALHPYDEDLVRLSMLALQQCGHTAEALRLYDATARAFAEELGVDPGKGLWEVHRKILQAPTVADPVHIPEGPPRPPVAAIPPRRKGALVAASAAFVVVLGVLGFSTMRPEQADDLSGSDELYSTLNLEMLPGNAHDLDVVSWEETLLPGGQPIGSPESNRGDLYRQKEVKDRLSGWPTTLEGSGGFNTFQPLSRDKDVTDCRNIPDSGQGNADVVTLREGDKFCVHTHEGRWALVTITGLPGAPGAPLLAEAKVLPL
ncbi:AfsR/SARP family transcriptional regulator [Kineosporia babensis]|uniref:Winged helix-turn-helix domain-containing protein n=1 Tax=Kineosporia babensis TaxID=499548 RepID=A0A9X1SZA5_9ACTN|nr:winged helix-turn-helix domain-containing protein [Kineosporia babensis]